MRKLGLGWIVVLSVATLLATGRATAAGPTTPPQGFFPIGVTGLEPDQFATWKGFGVNTVVGNITPGAWQEFWSATAVQDGLWQIRTPRTNPAQDNGQAYLLAWAYTDLPDVNNVPATTLAKTYASLKAVNPDRPIVIDLSAANPTSADAAYTATADWVSSQVFPISALNQPNWIDKTTATASAENPGVGVTKLSTISNGKPQLAYIETSDRDGTGPLRAPTADEVRGETWDAILHGATGIIYSPQGNGTTDATPASVSAGIKLTDALITKYSTELTSLDSSANFVNLGGGLEGTYRTVGGNRYYFVLNDSHGTITNARFALTGMTGASVVDVPEEGRTVEQTRGITTDSFTPYQVHIYSTEGSFGGGVGAGVPEPTGLAVLSVLGIAFTSRRRNPRRPS